LHGYCEPFAIEDAPKLLDKSCKFSLLRLSKVVNLELSLQALAVLSLIELSIEGWIYIVECASRMLALSHKRPIILGQNRLPTIAGVFKASVV